MQKEKILLLMKYNSCCFVYKFRLCVVFFHTNNNYIIKIEIKNLNKIVIIFYAFFHTCIRYENSKRFELCSTNSRTIQPQLAKLVYNVVLDIDLNM